MRSRAVVLLSMLVVAGLAACGGSANKAASTPSTPKATTSDRLLIEDAWIAFFSSKTPASKKEGLLQNGQKFSSVVKQMAQSPLAKNTSAKVTGVKVKRNTAKVAYTIYLGKNPALKRQIGTAVRENGTWKVSDASLCKLLALQGTKPAACKNVSS